ncbi:MAG TPA: type II and III secretion system family protein [Alphaproteobacteria bacterium]|nr:type II and III secretion system family protein [Alphaproteobacteria bacterium]USO06437.1 MAG: type II and III secretion system family protein [Rhodospirillales bacterium]HOO81534.1 type II and III secretion system family protein [Alphaproteobacteria bacterium]
MIVFHPVQNRFSFTVLSTCCVLFSSFFLTSCDMAKNQLKADREGSMEMQDYRDGLATRLPDTDEGRADQGAIPDLQPYVAQSSERMKPMPLVSIKINQSVPLRDALYELAQQADYDIELDPRIRGSIIFTATNRPFDVVIERIADIAGLRYKFEDDILRVELDTPYNSVYKIDYLSYIRNSKSSISNNVSVVSGDGTDSGSNFEADSESEANFWGELEVNLEQIVRGNQTGALKTKRDPRITAAEQNPDVQAVAPTSEDGTQVAVQPPQATLRVESLPVDDDDDTSSSRGKKDEPEGTFTINKQAGLINVYASEKAHKEIKEYLKLLKRAVTAQVLIEAKVLEVTLSDEYRTGIDWDIVGLPGEFSLDFASGSNIGTPLLTAAYNGNDIQSLITATSRFGTVRALASPRLTVLNNQPAVLNVATNRVFFEIDIDVTQDGVTAQTEVNTEIRNVPEGVLVNVQPSINLEDRTISMAVRPTVTSIVSEEPDPGIAYIIAQCGAPCNNLEDSLVPELNVQEIDSVVKVRSGQAIVMGGLLQDRAQVTDGGVPILGEAPIIGNLFKDHDDSVSKTELVIFLKATILDNPSDSVHNTDKDLYRQFSSDRRPLRF